MTPREKQAYRDTALAIFGSVAGLLMGFLLVSWLEPSPPKVGEVTAEVLPVDASEADDAKVEVEITATVPDPAPGSEEPVTVAVELAAPVMMEVATEEKVGAAPSAGDALPEVVVSPSEEIETCDHLIAKHLGDASPLRKRDGGAKAGFEVEIDGIINPWSVMTLTRPSEGIVSVNVIEEDAGDAFRFEAEDGEFTELGGTHVTWKAPAAPGFYCLKIFEKGADLGMCLKVAVLKPWDGESEYLEGYKIGRYQDKPFRGNPRYQKPRGFIEVTEENVGMWISPHLQLSQFLCKQKSGFPKYVLVDTRLLLKLEQLIEEMERRGNTGSYLYITSGFRTPAYNIAIGNSTSYSRHLYGDAADLFVDANRDGKLDDLDMSGSTTDADAKIIEAAINAVSATQDYLKGGLGMYSAASYGNPFIHLDTRGYDARWKK